MVQIGNLSLISLSWAIFSSSTLVTAYVNLVNIPRSGHGYTRTCIRALSHSVDCDKSVLLVDASNNYYDEDTISAICTASCKESLDRYLDQVKAACGTSRYLGADGLSYHGGYDAQQAWERFDYACMNNSAGDNCNLIMGKLAGVNPKNQQGTAPPNPDLMCNECALSGMKRQLEMPLASDLRADPAIADMVSSIASSCGTTVSITAAPSASPPWVMIEAQTTTSDSLVVPHPSPTTDGPEPTTLVDTVFTLSFAPIPMKNAHTEISVINLGAEDEL